MSDLPQTRNLPAQIAEAIAGIPKAFMPACVKAFDRLIGAGVDIPVACLAQQKARIDAQTSAYEAVEAAIAKSVAAEAGTSPEFVQQALNVLVRKSYRKQKNIEAVSVTAIEDLLSDKNAEQAAQEDVLPQEIDEDWLNVFERYAEDASTERMQNLWGRVLAGEIRRPGKFAMRTMRFLSEFSQTDALSFSAFASCTFGDIAPQSLVKPDDKKDIRDLMAMEAAGLIQGASGMGLTHTINFGAAGNAILREGSLCIVFIGEPNAKIANDAVALTPLGVELLALLPGRDDRASARLVATQLRSPEIRSALIGVAPNAQGNIVPIEILWQDDQPEAKTGSP